MSRRSVGRIPMTDQLSVITALVVVLMILAQVIQMLVKRKKNNPHNSELGALKVLVTNCNEEIDKTRIKQDRVLKEIGELRERVVKLETRMEE